MNTTTRVLFIGNARFGTNSRSLLEGFRQAGAEVSVLDTQRATASLVQRLRRKAGLADNAAQSHLFRDELTDVRRQGMFDMVLAVKTVTLDQAAIFDVPARHHVHLSFDDTSNVDNVSSDYLEYEKFWDLIITTKTYNRGEMLARGARAVLCIDNAYDPSLHVNLRASGDRPWDLSFIGVARPDRIDLPKRLSTASVGPSVVYGPKWRRHYLVPPRNVSIRPSVWGASYADALNSARAGLVLLNSENRDLQTARTFELAAAGQLVVAPATDEHRRIYGDGDGAILFNSLDEGLIEAADVLSDSRLTQAMVNQSRNRIMDSRATYADRAREILEEVNN